MHKQKKLLEEEAETDVAANYDNKHMDILAALIAMHITFSYGGKCTMPMRA
jgi:hypothetical protein